MIKKTTLQNKLRVVTKRLESTKAVTVLIFVAAGSRYETKMNSGISHFLEHMFFKGGVKYKNTKEVSGAIDGVGGDFNAFTGKEYVGYYVKVAEDKLSVALDVLSDMLIHAQFDPKEIDKERGVIMEELNMYQDTPMYQVSWDFETLLYGDQPLGWDQIGSKELIRTVTRDDFKAYQNDLYTPENIVIAVAGNVDHDEIVGQVEKLFPFEERAKKYGFLPVTPFTPASPVHIVNKSTEQAHLVCGVEGYSNHHENKYAKKLLSVVLGGNMSSRMFLNVREDKGLAYYISTSTDFFEDTGALSTRAGVDVNRIPLAIEAIINEYEEIARNAPPEEELQKAKDYMKGKMVLKLEDTEEYAYMIAHQELFEGELESIDDIYKKIDAVTVEEVHAVAKELFSPERYRVALIGPWTDVERLEKALKGA